MSKFTCQARRSATVYLGDDIAIRIDNLRGDRCRVTIVAPQEVEIVGDWLLKKIAAAEGLMEPGSHMSLEVAQEKAVKILASRDAREETEPDVMPPTTLGTGL